MINNGSLTKKLRQNQILNQIMITQTNLSILWVTLVKKSRLKIFQMKLIEKN